MSLNKKDVNKNIQEYALKLKTPGIKKYFEEEAKEAGLLELSYEEYLLRLLEKEWELRQENAKQNRIRIANFPYKKYIEDLVVEDLPEDAQKKLKLLVSLNFIKSGQNVILAGNAGTGKNTSCHRYWNKSMPCGI